MTAPAAANSPASPQDLAAGDACDCDASDNGHPLHRIAIIGPSGSGKSTLARRVGEILELDVVHLDRLHWRPGWVEAPRDDFRNDLVAVLARDRWVIDGNYGRTQSLTLPRADTVVWLDFAMPLCMWRIIARAIEYNGVSRPDLPAGCPETPDWEFVRWVWSFPKNERPRIVEKLALLRQDQRLIILRNPREVVAFERSLRRMQARGSPFGASLLTIGRP
jgi:adenylate kinase family enzyme